jgi:type IV secretion system protein VirB10
MRLLLAMTLLSAVAWAEEEGQASQALVPASGTAVTVPAGTKIPVALKQAISTKSAREGDVVYAETTFPFVQDGRVLIPAGTYLQGQIVNTQRPGRTQGRAEVLIHFTSLVYPNGYTVPLPGAIDKVPGADRTQVTGPEGTVQEDSQSGQKVAATARTSVDTAVKGAVLGGLPAGGNAAAIGAGAGGALGAAIAFLTRGRDVRLDARTTVEMVIQRPITLDTNRAGIPGAASPTPTASLH